MYSMWKIMCFLNLKPHKRIALHQIHKIMLFLATSYHMTPLKGIVQPKMIIHLESTQAI